MNSVSFIIMSYDNLVNFLVLSLNIKPSDTRLIIEKNPEGVDYDKLRMEYNGKDV